MTVNIRSFNQILGQMVRKIVADTPLNDIREGSALLTLLEAAAQSDFENNASILNVLELLSIDALRNSDLDARATDLGLSRIAAQRSTGFVEIGDSSITKRSTTLFQVKPAPIAGSTVLFVNDAQSWNSTGGELFIGRGTANFEGPITYTSIIDNGSFYTINLASALQKDHLSSETVVDAQGTADRRIVQGTVVIIPPNNQNPQIEFRTLRDATIPAGEDVVTNVPIVSIVAGTRSNAGINTITQFSSPPFTTATVTNTTAITDGRDVESDDDFRERIKAYSNSLARGTENAILSEVIGVSDNDDGKQVVSATITEPPRVGDPSILYIDDSTGFQPSFQGQSVDQLLTEASGNEEFLQLANFPLPRPQAVNAADGPYEISEGMTLRVLVDGVEEQVTFSTSQFINSASATLAEVIVAINDQSNTFKCTFTANSTRLLLFPTSSESETIQVAALRDNEDSSLYANSQFKFPTDEFSYIRLFQNSTLLSERARSASLLTNEFSSWNILSQGNIVIEVDGTPAQDRLFTTTDFGGTTFEALTLDDWVNAFNQKFAGLTATATSSGRMQITSNNEGAASLVNVVGGSFFDTWFTGLDTRSAGRNSDFELNRQNGNIRILTPISQGDTISAGSEDTKGSITSSSTTTGTYNLATDANSRRAEAVITSDMSDFAVRESAVAPLNGTITISDQGSSVMRVMSSSVTSFASVVPGDFIFITNRGSLVGWVDPENAGIFKIVAKGGHSSAGVDSYVEVKNATIVPGTHTVDSADDVHVFKSDTYPQIWSGLLTPNPASSTLNDIVESFDDNLVNVIASIFKTNSVKLTSTTEDGGSIAVPVSTGNASTLFATRQGQQSGTPSQIANRANITAATGYFKRTEPSNSDIWLGRYIYSDVRGTLTSDAEPGTAGVDVYSEQLEATGVLTDALVDYDDVLNITGGSNKSHYRSVRDLLAGDVVGTQHELPRTVMDYVVDEDINIMRPLTFYPDDSIVFILDQDSVAKTIDVSMSRTGVVNNEFTATDLSFSANDADNEPGITFGNLQVWGKDTADTEFQNYAVWFRARNWYVSGGVGSGGGSMILRADEYGPHGERLRFTIDYPQSPALAATISHNNLPEHTDITFRFGSDIEIPTSIVAADQFTVTDLGGNNFRYTFQSVATDFSQIAADNIVTFGNDSGVSAANRGTLRITAVDDSLKTIDVYNPSGSATIVGSAEVTQVTTAADIAGSTTNSNVIVNKTGTGVNDGDYFVIEDSAGLVAVYYQKILPLPTPGSLGVNRIISVTLSGGESDATVAGLTAGALAADSEFIASAISNILNIDNVDNGPFQIAADGTVAFVYSGTVGVADDSLEGEYFILQDQNGSVAFWYDVSGVATEPLHGADRSVEIVSVVAGDSAIDVASKTAVAITSDSQFSASAATNIITITDANNGVRPTSSAGTTPFTVAQITAGVDDTFETISIPLSVKFYPLLNTAVDEIATVVSSSPLIEATVLDNSNDIVLATKDEVYTPAGIGDFSVSLAYGHDPASTNNDYVSFYDSISWVKDFENSNPQFALKSPLILQGVAPSAYSIDSTVNRDSTETGEFFKLVPTTLNNLLHHFTQKALSQLPIVADVDIASNIRGVQVKSKIVGSSGAVEVVGGNANSVQYSIFDEGVTVTQSGKDFTELTIASSPVTLTDGTLISVENTNAAQRLSRVKSSDTLDVSVNVDQTSEYIYNQKDNRLNNVVKMSVADQSATYSRPAGTVWRWTFNDAGSKFRVTGLSPALAGTAPNDFNAAGTGTTAALVSELVQTGSATDVQILDLSVNDLPTQADYFIFEGPSGDTFAVYFDIDGANIQPAGGATPFGLSTHKIEVDILSSDSPNQVTSKLSTVLLADLNFLADFSGVQLQGANYDEVGEGDTLIVGGALDASWPSGNKSRQTGDGKIAGFPIIATTSSYIDVVNPNGVAMSDVSIESGSVNICPTPFLEWKLGHYAKTKISNIIISSGTATVNTPSEHNLEVGDSITIEDTSLAQTVTVLTVDDPITFTFIDTTAAADGTYDNGFVIESGKTESRYRIESVGFNNLYRLKNVLGDAPRFTDFGVAVDDLMIISGETFASNNTGVFRVLGVDNESVLFENSLASEQRDLFVPFNNLQDAVNWVSNFDEVSGTAGTFKNVAIGTWVKKKEDSEERFVQVIDLLDASDVSTTAELAVKLKLGQNYTGTSSSAEGVAFDQISGPDAGIVLDSIDDIRFLEGDAARVGDSIFIDNIANSSWFSSSNAGNFTIQQIGTNASYRPFVRVENSLAIAQTGVDAGVSLQGLFILESDSNKFSSVRLVEHSSIDETDSNKRQIYVTPETRTYKMSRSNGTVVRSLGKLNYSSDVTIGIDGYNYYTGLLRTVQRILDGFEPEATTFPGRRAVGSAIETLGPLIKKVSIALDVVTTEGVNVNEIISDVKSSIIDYVDDLGVGEDVILSEIIVRVMEISGVESVTFTTPSPNTDRIAVADNEKPFVTSDNIAIA
jgi:uncharacterized phage protein gp47/JayE